MLVALWFFTTRDDATTSAPAVAAPGRALRTDSDRATRAFAADLRRGNVVLVANPQQVAAAKALAQDVAGPPEPSLRAAGQAVLVRRGFVETRQTLVDAYAQNRVLAVADARDPALRAFVEYWLGRAAG